MCVQRTNRQAHCVLRWMHVYGTCTFLACGLHVVFIICSTCFFLCSFHLADCYFGSGAIAAADDDDDDASAAFVDVVVDVVAVVVVVALLFPFSAHYLFSYRLLCLNMNMHCRYADTLCTKTLNKHLCSVFLCDVYYYRIRITYIFLGSQVTANKCSFRY